MATKVLVPRLGEGVEEVTITKWLKQEGDSVKELEPLLEVNTDKVDTEIPSPASGVLLKIVLPEGHAAKVGEVLAVIGTAWGKCGCGSKRFTGVKRLVHRSRKLVSAPTEVICRNGHLRLGNRGYGLHLPCRREDRRRTWRESASGKGHRS